MSLYHTGSTYAASGIYNENSSWIYTFSKELLINNALTGGVITFASGGTTESARFNSSGYFGIGTGSTVSATLHVKGTGGANTGIRIESTGTTYAPIDFYTPSGLGGQFLATGSTFSSGIFGANQIILVNYLAGGTIIGSTHATAPVILLAGGSAASNAYYTITPATTSGVITNHLFTTNSSTNQTLSTNIPNFKVTGSTKQWATGALATQYFNYFSANTVSFVGASTATHVANFRSDAPLQGTNATATNLYAIDCGGHLFVANSVGVPSNNPTGGGILYVEAGELKYRGSSGTVTSLGLA
jgi:hypothetical protein